MTTTAFVLAKTPRNLNVDSSGNLVISTDAIFDTNTLFVDESANRVGMGTITPSTRLDVVGDITASGSLFVPTIDTADSSAITVTPAATFSSDVSIENDLIVNNTVTATRFIGAVTGTITGTASNAELLDNLDSTQFLRTDTSDNITSGTVTFDSGTTLTAASGATVNFSNTTGTAPFTVASTTVVTNLNADTVDGIEAAAITQSGDSVALTGDVTGSTTVGSDGGISIATTIAANSVALGTDTTGDYVQSLTAGALIDLQNNSGESATPTIDVDLSELTDMTDAAVGSDELVILDAGSQKRKAISEITLGLFDTANQIAMGTDTTGNYVATVTGTANEIEVSGSGSETAAVTVGLPSDVTIGNNLTVTTSLFTPIIDTTDSSAITVTPAATFESDVIVSNDLQVLHDMDITGSLIISGNLTVNGTQTIINSEEKDIGDAIIKLNSDETGTPSQDAGIEIERGTSTNVKILWNETSDKWTLTEDGSTFYNILTTADEGAGNGIDADTLDGQQGSYYLDGANFTGSLPNNYVTLGTMSTGNYVATVAGTANEVEVSGSGSETAAVTVGLPAAVQITTSLTVGGNSVLTTADEGSGNGIDADTVDGLEATSFIRADATDSATGVITFSNATAATNTTTGAVIVTGGVGIGGAAHIGGTLDVTGVITGPTTDTLLIKNSAGATLKTIRGV